MLSVRRAIDAQPRTCFAHNVFHPATGLHAGALNRPAWARDGKIIVPVVHALPAGGPRDWFEANPGKCMMSAHRGLGVSRETAEQWVDAMTRAIAECGPEDRALGQVMAERLAMMAQAMARD